MTKPFEVKLGGTVHRIKPLPPKRAVANDPAFQSLLSAADQIGRQMGRVRG